jgi:1-phosphatidylinositol-4-phosphate 5-kinase
MGNIQSYIKDYINIGICYCLENNKSEKQLGLFEINENNLTIDLNNPKTYNFSKSSIKEDSILYSDDLVNSVKDIFFEITDYYPKVFHFLRKIENIDENIMIRSFIPMLNKNTFEKSEGKSKDFFINTYDNLFMLKTINNYDKDFILNNFFKKYSSYLPYNNDSLLCRIYGIYKIRFSGILLMNEINFVIIRNLTGLFNPENIFVKYDLKGSIHNRKMDLEYETLQKEVLKDINFEEREGKCIMLYNRDSEKIINILKKDAEFLSNCEIIDYSLLVIKICITEEENKYIYGNDDSYEFYCQFYDYLNNKLENNNFSTNNIEELIKLIKNEFKFEKKENKKPIISNYDLSFNKSNLKFFKKNIFKSLEKNKIYVLGIIDYFQYFNYYKSFESKYKSLLYGKENISAVPPKDYEDRFLNYLIHCLDFKYILEKYLKLRNEKDK